MTSREIPKSKIQTVNELKDLIKNKKTVLVASIKNIPGSQFQEISKKLRGKAIVKVPKKNLMIRALNNSENEKVKKLQDSLQNSIAILFSDLDSFELASELLQNTSPAKAKPGQISPEDIKIEEGPTDLPPGPAISELGNVGLQVQIEKGKIHIKKSKVIVKEGEKISASVADAMNKLDIKPFRIGFIPLVAFDRKDDRLYLEIEIDKEGTLKELANLFSKALAFAVEIGQYNEETIGFMIGRAASHEKALSNLNQKKEIKKEEESKKTEKDSENKGKSEKEENTQSEEN